MNQCHIYIYICNVHKSTMGKNQEFRRFIRIHLTDVASTQFMPFQTYADP